MPGTPTKPRGGPAPDSVAPRLIAFYLPQFHPIPENDKWWGTGFTEWTNVVRAEPQFIDHYQPHLPGELGFYDLRVPETREQQAALAREHGVHGFCYYHYWFGGRRLLDRPFREVLKTKAPDLPFCLCWANENWTRNWDGASDQILVAQAYSPQDDERFITELFDAFADDRYIRVDDKPLLLVYRPSLLPDARATAERWREACHRAGIGDLFLCNVHSLDAVDPRSIGFDASVDFPPVNKPLTIARGIRFLNQDFTGNVCNYWVPTQLDAPEYTLFPTVVPSWDNTPRRDGRATILMGSTPERYGEWLDLACRHVMKEFAADRRLVFVNAWNEWGEGCHLEPDARYGRAYLETTRDILARYERQPFALAR